MTLKYCESETFLRDFQTLCLMMEPKYFGNIRGLNQWSYISGTTSGIYGLFSNNPMLRYRTSNGPITCRMGLMALSTMQQSQNAYLPAKP